VQLFACATESTHPVYLLSASSFVPSRWPDFLAYSCGFIFAIEFLNFLPVQSTNVLHFRF
jgi:hypothetical protein